MFRPDPFSAPLAANGSLELIREGTQFATQAFPGSSMRNVRQLARQINDATRRFDEFAKPLTRQVVAVGYIVDGFNAYGSAVNGNWGDSISTSAGIALNFTGPIGKVAGFVGQQIIDRQVKSVEDANDALDQSGIQLSDTMRRINTALGLRKIDEWLREYQSGGCGQFSF